MHFADMEPTLPQVASPVLVPAEVGSLPFDFLVFVFGPVYRMLARFPSLY